jgi:catechol 2,3-dioxygenase-like lactoylglutathione lyase family enzyme
MNVEASVVEDPMHAAECDVSIAHVTVEVSRPDRLRSCLDTLVGDNARVSFDDAPRRGSMRVVEGPRDDLALLGLAFPSERALDTSLRRLQANGIAWEQTEPPSGWTRAVRTADPAGTPLELLVRGPGWPADDGWPVGHVALAHPRVAELERFYADVIGLRCNERLAARVGPLSLQGSFLGSARHHHAVAILNLPSFRRLHHVFFGAPDVGVVTERWFRARAAGIHMSMELGRHALPDGTTSFYAASPAGFDLEIGSGGGVLDGSEMVEPLAGSTPSSWGHTPSVRARLKVAAAMIAQRLGNAA